MEFASQWSKYKATHEKPDKKYSMLPTMLSLLGDVQGRNIVSLGCGDGFFEIPLGERGADVIGLDKELEVLRNARRHPRVTYAQWDIFTDDRLPTCDDCIAPFVLNYSPSVQGLRRLLNRMGRAASQRIAGIVDLPERGDDLRRFGAVKTVEGELRDEARLTIDLYAPEHVMTIRDARYYAPETVERTLLQEGFSVTWHIPIISPEGIERYGEEFWEGYTVRPGLGYFLATRR